MRFAFFLLYAFAWQSVAATVLAQVQAAVEPIPGRWTAERARTWYDQQPWLVGANFVPSTAINQLEMWQPETFDPVAIDRELGWAADIGMNTMRVFLHDIPWREDPEGFCHRIDQYLEIADRHGIRTLLVLFDAVWNPVPKSGKQPDPSPHIHNSGWVQSPGKEILGDPARHDELAGYVKGIVSRYKNDDRIVGWDLFNEPDNANAGKWVGTEEQDLPPPRKHQLACELLEKAFRWAREVNPTQPLTCGVWRPRDWLNNPSRIESISLANSDVISFHTYEKPETVKPILERLVGKFNRPLLCTEYMARGNGSTFEGILPLLKGHRIAAYNWGLVDGKSQTIYPWDSWKKKYTAEPELWFHDVFHRDGTPYREAEVTLIRNLATDFAGSRVKKTDTEAALAPEEITQGLDSHDRALFIKAGWIRDPYIVLAADGYYYLTGTTPLPGDTREKSDPYNTGLGDTSIVGWKMQAWRSKDLAVWEELGTPFTLKDGIWFEKRPRRFAKVPEDQWRLWAPELHEIDGRWAVIHTSPGPVPGANLVLSTRRELKGPWHSPMGTSIQRRHDPSLFHDDDGTWWLIWGATVIAPLKSDFSGLTAEPTPIGPSGATTKMGHEGCLIRKIGNKYVLFGTGWSTGQMRKGSYNLYYALADKVTGPYGPRQFAGRFLGHGTPFQDKEGRWWCTAFFNGNVPTIESDGIVDRDLRDNAYSINHQGVTIVPLSIDIDSQGTPTIRAKDPRYASPGPDESQQFPIDAAASMWTPPAGAAA